MVGAFSHSFHIFDNFCDNDLIQSLGHRTPTLSASLAAIGPWIGWGDRTGGGGAGGGGGGGGVGGRKGELDSGRRR